MYVEVPVIIAGLVAMWGLAVLLLSWGTDSGPQAAAWWGLFTTAVAAVWTLGYLLKRHMAALRFAYELGRQEAKPPVTSLDERR